MGGWTKEQAERRQKITADLCARFPDTGARTLGRKLHEEHPVLFTSTERGRSAVREYLGLHGFKSKRLASKRQTVRAPRKPGELPPLPKSEAKGWEPYNLCGKRVLVLADIHLPYHDADAVEAALEHGDKFGPDAVLINGDLFDMYSISRFAKDPTKPKLKYELECGKQFFDHLRARYPKADLYFRYGNHDRRLDLYLMLAAPELFDVEGYLDVWHKPAGITENGIVVIREQRPVMLGKLPVFHGDELPRGMASPVNPARGAFLRTLASLLHSHLHRTSEHTERTMDGQTITCRTTGALCGLWPEYARINKWDHGFATVLVAQDGCYEVNLRRIIDGKVY